MKTVWFDEAWDDYVEWQARDKKTLNRINQLIQDSNATAIKVSENQSR